MKKLFFLSMVALAAVAFSSCKSCNREKTAMGAKVTVTVKNIFGSPQDGTKVYMFKDLKPTNSTNPGTAADIQVTDLDGNATFNLNFTDLDIREGKTTLYFAVFYQNDNNTMVAGKEGIMLTNGETKHIDITIPI